MKKPSERVFEIFLGGDRKTKIVFKDGNEIVISAIEEAMLMYLDEQCNDNKAHQAGG